SRGRRRSFSTVSSSRCQPAMVWSILAPSSWFARAVIAAVSMRESGAGAGAAWTGAALDEDGPADGTGAATSAGTAFATSPDRRGGDQQENGENSARKEAAHAWGSSGLISRTFP